MFVSALPKQTNKQARTQANKNHQTRRKHKQIHVHKHTQTRKHTHTHKHTHTQKRSNVQATTCSRPQKQTACSRGGAGKISLLLEGPPIKLVGERVVLFSLSLFPLSLFLSFSFFLSFFLYFLLSFFLAVFHYFFLSLSLCLSPCRCIQRLDQARQRKGSPLGFHGFPFKALEGPRFSLKHGFPLAVQKRRRFLPGRAAHTWAIRPWPSPNDRPKT